MSLLSMQTSQWVQLPLDEVPPSLLTPLGQIQEPPLSRFPHLYTRRHSQQPSLAASCTPSWWNPLSALYQRPQWRWQESEEVYWECPWYTQTLSSYNARHGMSLQYLWGIPVTRNSIHLKNCLKFWSCTLQQPCLTIAMVGDTTSTIFTIFY